MNAGLQAADKAEAHCRELVRAADLDAYLGTLLAPRAHQPRLFAIWSIAADALRLPWNTTEPQMAMIRLQWWREAIKAGEGHPALHLLNGIGEATLTAFLDATERLHGAPFTPKEAQDWGRAAFSPLMKALGGEGETDDAFAAACGMVFLLRRAPLRRPSGIPLLSEDRAAYLARAAELMRKSRPRYAAHLLPFSLARPWLRLLKAEDAPRYSQPRRQIYLLTRLLMRRI